MPHQRSQISTSSRKPLEALSTNLRLPTLNDTPSGFSTTLPPFKVLLAKYGLPEDDDESVHVWLQNRFIAENGHLTNASQTSSNHSCPSSTIPHPPRVPLAEYGPPYNDERLIRQSLPRKLLEDKKAPNTLSALSTSLSHTSSASRPPASKLLRTYGLPDDDDELIYPWLYQRYLEDSKDPIGTSTKARLSVFNDDDEDSDTSLKSFKTILASSKRKQRRASIEEEADLHVTSKRRRPSTTNVNHLRVGRRMPDVPPSTSKPDARRSSNKGSTYDGIDLIGTAGDTVLNTRPRRSRTSTVSYALPELELPEETQEERRKAQRLYEMNNATDSGEDFHPNDDNSFSNEAADIVRESEVDTESNDLSKRPGSPSQLSYASPGELRESSKDKGVVISKVEPDNNPSKVMAKSGRKSRKVPLAKHVGVALNGNGKPTKAKNHRAAERPATHRPRNVSVFAPTVFPVTTTFDDLRAFQSSLSQTRVIQWRCRDLVEPAGLMAIHDKPKVRDCVPQNVTRISGQGRWSVTVKPQKTDVGSLTKPVKGYITFTFPDSRYDEPLAQAVVPALKQLIDRWPVPIQWNLKDRSRRAWSAAFLNAATEITQKNFDEKVDFRAHKVMYFIDCYHIDIPFFDSEDGTMQLYRESINPSSMTNLQIPDVPGHYRFDKYGNQRRSESRPVRIARRPEGSAEMARHEASEKLCKLLYFKLYGKIASKATMARLACEELARLNIRRRYKKNGPYGGVRLYSTCLLRRAGCVRFRPSYWLQRDVEGYISEITLLSLRGVQILQVEGAIDEAWARSGNPVTAWEAGAIEAFLLNANLLSDGLASYCNCTEFEALTTVHVCQQCRRMTLCSTLLIDDYGNQICAQCDEEQQKDTQFARYIMSRQANTSLDKSHEEYRAYVNFHRRQYEECGNLQISKSDTGLQAETWDRFRETHCVLQDGKFLIRDFYTGALRQVVPPRRDRKSKRKQPFIISCDGWFPYVFHKGRIRYHVPENIVPVALYINYLKWTFVPAMLQMLVDYRRQTTKDTETFVKDMDGVQAIALQIAHRKKVRLQQAGSLTEAELLTRMEIDKQEWVSGRPREFDLREEALISRLSQHCFGKHSEEDYLECEMGWNAKDIGRMEQVIAEAEGVFGRQVARSPADYAPWPFHDYSMPDHWCWPLLWKLFKTRLTRMTIACNRKWETVDNEETLLLQCIIQHLDPEHKEFLGLPLVPFIRHPLRFSVAHKHHNRQMRTGFTTTHPLSLGDYDAVLNNVLFETWLSNAMKLDFDEDLYDAMLADLDTINLGRDSYDPDMARVKDMEDDGDFPLADCGEWEIEEDDTKAEYEEEAGGVDNVEHDAEDDMEAEYEEKAGGIGEVGHYAEDVCSDEEEIDGHELEREVDG